MQITPDCYTVTPYKSTQLRYTELAAEAEECGWKTKVGQWRLAVVNRGKKKHFLVCRLS